MVVNYSLPYRYFYGAEGLLFIGNSIVSEIKYSATACTKMYSEAVQWWTYKVAGELCRQSTTTTVTKM